ncbi:hypothetical protein [Haloferax sp. YSSS75]
MSTTFAIVVGRIDVGRMSWGKVFAHPPIAYLGTREERARW